MEDHIKAYGLPEEFRKFYARMQSIFPELQSTASDRACVLVVTAMIDNALETLLRTAFLCNPEVSKKDCDCMLDGGLAPLRGAAVRARLAFILTLIDKATYQSIKYAIDRRNEFAHQMQPAPISDEIAKTLFDKLPQMAQEVTLGVDAECPLPPGHEARIRFIGACVGLCCILDAKTVQIELSAKNRQSG